MMDYNIRHGRTYMYFKGEPLYPFGYGLSYTTFAYSNLRDQRGVVERQGLVDVSVDVKNTGARAGDEVVQLYVKHIGSAVDRPNKELRGFKRVAIEAGETKTVTITLPASRLAYWNTASKSLGHRKRQGATHGRRLLRGHQTGPHHRCDALSRGRPRDAQTLA